MKKNFFRYLLFLFSSIIFGLFIASASSTAEAKNRFESCDLAKKDTSCSNPKLICYPDQPPNQSKGICDFSREKDAPCNPANTGLSKYPQCNPNLACAPTSPSSGTCQPADAVPTPVCNPNTPNSCGTNSTCAIQPDGKAACIAKPPTGTHEGNLCGVAFGPIGPCDNGLVCSCKEGGVCGLTEDKLCRKPPNGFPCNPDDKTFCGDGLVCRKSSDDQKDYFCYPPLSDDKSPDAAPPPPCAKYEGNKCVAFNTSFGDIETDAAGFIRATFGVILSLSGAVALFLIIRAGYKIMTSEGKPEPLQEGRDQLIAAIVGLLFLIFSFVMLQLIGVDILKIPGFGGPTGEGKSCDTLSKQCGTGLTCVPVGGTHNGICTDTSDKSQKSNPDQPETADTPENPDIASCKGELIKVNHKSDCVRTLQHALGVPEDSIYSTDNAQDVIDFQTSNGLIIDGVVGPCTWGALAGEPIPDSCKRQ